jgi:long-chain acyl-CoA synthetase
VVNPGWTLAGVLRHHRASRPDRTAITDRGRTLSWAALDARSSQVAQALAAEGVGSQDRVAFVDKNGAEFFEVWFGAAKLGAVLTPINWRLATVEMCDIVNDAEPRVLFVGPDFADQLETIRDQLVTVKTIVNIDGPSGHQTYEEWMSRWPAVDPNEVAHPDDVLIQVYTSGTTGLPKGAMMTNTNLGLMAAVGPGQQVDSDSNYLIAMPLFHLGGSGAALLSLTAGANTVLARDANPEGLLEIIQRERITNGLLVPAVLQSLTALAEAADGDYSALREITYGASPITNAVLERSLQIFGCDFFQIYGLTETGILTHLDPADHDPGGPRAHLLRSAGKPYPHLELSVVDPDTGQGRPPLQVGEVWTRSAQVMKGYWHKPDETAKSITADGWFRTGDAGYLDADGFLFLTDRVKDMIVSGGENIYPVEIENVLADHPAVADVAVIGVPDSRWGEAVKGIVVVHDGATADEDELIDWCRQRIAHYKSPRSIDFVTELPRNPSGKILKRQLREPYWAQHSRQVN